MSCWQYIFLSICSWQFSGRGHSPDRFCGCANMRLHTSPPASFLRFFTTFCFSYFTNCWYLFRSVMEQMRTLYPMDISDIRMYWGLLGKTFFPCPGRSASPSYHCKFHDKFHRSYKPAHFWFMPEVINLLCQGGNFPKILCQPGWSFFFISFFNFQLCLTCPWQMTGVKPCRKTRL